MKRFYFFLSLFLSVGLVATAQDHTITFEVDMTDFINDGGTIDASGMHVAGNFQDEAGLSGEWTPSESPMADQGNNIWSVTYTLPAGTYEYKYVLGNDWSFGSENISGDCGPGNGNREIVVDGDKTESFCYSKCSACGVVIPKVNVTFQVDMTNMALRYGDPNNDIVSVAGAFQGWTPGETVMTDDDGDGIFTVTAEADAGSSFGYKFLYGDDWGYDEGVPGDCNQGGNRFVELGDSDTTLAPVCFGTCDQACPDLGDPLTVTFLVDMRNEIVSNEGLHVAGTVQFPAWVKDTWELTDEDGNGIYSGKVENMFTGSYAYKFINGTGDADEEMNDFIAGGCGIDNGVGGSNRELVVDLAQDTVIAFVYNSCDQFTDYTQEDIDNAPVVNGISSVTNTTAIESYRLYPNPFTNRTVLEFSNPDAKPYMVTITDMMGRVVRTMNNVRAEQVLIDRGSLSSGLYLVNLRDEAGGQLTLKMIVR